MGIHPDAFVPKNRLVYTELSLSLIRTREKQISNVQKVHWQNRFLLHNSFFVYSHKMRSKIGSVTILL